MAAVELDRLLSELSEQNGSDLHLKVNRPPLMRVAGSLTPTGYEEITPQSMQEAVYALMAPSVRKKFEQNLEADFSYEVPGLARFRVNVFVQRGQIGSVFRLVPIDVPTVDGLGLPQVLKTLSDKPNGQILVTGPTGSGKSTTLACMMEHINQTRPVHIVTVEDPIEFVYTDQMATINQRELGIDTRELHAALRAVLRQDPDVILIGEMRDAETMRFALTAAETGHLVFSTLHTNSAVQTIDRIMDSFPESSHRQLRQQLSCVLEAVVSMKLVERADGKGLIAAVEILRRTPRVSKLLLQGNLEALEEEIESSVAYHKMQCMNQSLAALVVNRAITMETALASSTNPGDLDLILRKLLYIEEQQNEEEGNAMAEPLSDFSKIIELQEIRKAYEEQQERHGSELAELEEKITRLNAELAEQAQQGQQEAAEGGDVAHLRDENERLSRQLQLVRGEYESKVERLNASIRELSGGAPRTAPPASDAERKGFFRR